MLKVLMDSELILTFSPAGVAIRSLKIGNKPPLSLFFFNN